MKRIPSILAAIGLLALLAAGCSQDGNPAASSGTATDDYTQIDLDKDFGGLTATDEEIAFADDELNAALAAADQEICDDPLARHPDVVRMDRDGRDPAAPDSLRPHLTFVRLRWGHLSGPVDSLDADGACDRTEWNGTLSIDRGLLVVRRVLAFERPGDHLVFPRLNGQTVSLESHTRCGHDGLVLQILERPAAPAGMGVPLEPNFLHIDLGPFSADYDIAALATTDEVIEVDATGNSFEVSGVRPRRPDACPSGFLAGRYRPLPADRPDTAGDNGQTHLGRFTGVWHGLDGGMGGFLRGVYGLDSAGQRVFVGKYISTRGHFRGLIRGTWEQGVTAGDLAHFQGQWFNAAGTAEGVLAGDGHPVPDGRGGWFSGRWATSCDEAADSIN